MKIKFFLLISLFVVSSYATNPTWTTPNRVAVSGVAVNDYSMYVNTTSLNRAILAKNTFINSLFSSIDNAYPGKTRYVAYNYENSAATVLNYKQAQLYHSEFVFFSGHGNQQLIGLYDYPMVVSEGCAGDGCNVTNYGKVYGGDTRWVIFDACLVLNVNKENMLEFPLSTTSIDLSKVDKLRTVFRGVHAILGFYALGWEDAFTVGEDLLEGSEDLYRFFSDNFIEDGETIWDAFSMANSQLYLDFDNAFFQNHGYHHIGLKPAIAFLRGYDSNGRYHDTSLETFNHTFSDPIKITGSLELYVMYSEYGTPEYYAP